MQGSVKTSNYLSPVAQESGSDATGTPNVTLVDAAAGKIKTSDDFEDAHLVGGADVAQDAHAIAIVGTIANIVSVQCDRSSALTRLPYEMLARIFSYSSGDSGIKIPADLNAASPWNFSRVCSRWKAVAESTPKLWMTITIDFGDWSNHVGYINLVNVILSRHPQSLVSLTITPGRGHYYNVREPIVYVTNHLLDPYSKRLKYLCFKEGYLFHPFLTKPPGSVDLLETLHWTVSYEMPSASIFRNAPSLRKVFIDARSSLQLWGETFRPFDLPIPWSQLTHLHLPGSFFPPADAFALLRQSVNLKDCRLGITTPGQGNTTGLLHPTTITLPTLESFLVEDRDFSPNGQPPSNITNILKVLNLPNLIDFEITLDYAQKGPSIGWDDLAFIEFIQRCSSLKNLAVKEVVPSQYLELLLQSAPSLEKLSIQDGDELPIAALQRLSNPDFLPNLGVLRCYVVHLDAFVDMLESRWEASCSSLNEVFIDLDTNGGGANYLSRKRVKALREAGKNVTLRG